MLTKIPIQSAQKLRIRPSTFTPILRAFSQNHTDEGYKSINREKDRIYSLADLKTIKGHATSEGTFAYTQRNKDKVPQSNFNVTETRDGPLHLSKIGYGTYIGDPSTEHDKLVYDALIKSVLTGGVNVIDTAINYRYMKAERTVGAAISELVNNQGIKREELFIASKGGYLTVSYL